MQHNMNNKLIAIGIIIIFLIVAYSGCLSNESDKFVGRWQDDDGVITRVYSDGSVIEEYQGESLSGSWKIEDNRLIVTFSGGSTTYRYDYHFSDNDNTLYLTKDSTTQKLTKISNSP